MIAWTIKWDDICKTREEGGLGIIYIIRFRKALIPKSKRRLGMQKYDL